MTTTPSTPSTMSSHKWLNGDADKPIWREHDACAIVASIRKGGEATHGNLKRVLNALSKMGHRSGDVNGEGDGCGVLTDIPRAIWADLLDRAGKPSWLADDRRFFVGHLMLPNHDPAQLDALRKQVFTLLKTIDADVILQHQGQTRPHALGKLAREQEPFFWQISGIVNDCPLEQVEGKLFGVAMRIERETGIHVASLSSHSVVYKVRGSVETLYHYYPDLRSPSYTSAITLAHTRYSTNTTTAFERVQPFLFLGHNGEINTIARLREQAKMLGMQLSNGGSDSQDVDRVLGALIHAHGLTLTEAMEIVFPPIWSEVQTLPEDMQRVYEHNRKFFGPFAQGPAGMIARYGDECVFSVDALGLRPLWFGETEKEYFFSSEKGVYFLESLDTEPKPLSPGEKMTLRVRRNRTIDVLTYAEIQTFVVERAKQRQNTADVVALHKPHRYPPKTSLHPAKRTLPAFGWSKADADWVTYLGDSGYGPIGSLGYDAALAALSDQRKNLADYFKEAVAVVTNPAIDREREQEHFSTRTFLGARPAWERPQREPNGIFLPHPFLHETLPEHPAAIQQVTARFNADKVAVLDVIKHKNETLPDALDRLAETAIQHVRDGVVLLILDDAQTFTEGAFWVDPHLATAVIDRALRATCVDLDITPCISLRRHVSLVLRSGALRNLHDMILALGLGADAVLPYFLIDIAMGNSSDVQRLENTLNALRVGLEKITSTMGIHELRGYGRLFASIGLSDSLASALGTINYAGSDLRGLSWDDLERDLLGRQAIATGQQRGKLPRDAHFYPKVWKAAGQVGSGEKDAGAFELKVAETAQKNPVTLRHVIDFHYPETSRIDPAEVDTGLTGHDLPFVIASMSFGSQSEIAFRAYAEGAYRLNMLSLNGEGGEILDMMGLYPHNRGQQIASGRFGVDINLINSSNLLEIKIGQGAKPGEGGHLPGRKVSAKVAAARHARQGVDLISPSNNHDIYSIEDLAQFIEELKTANPKARVAVKVPVVPGIGIIAVGIAKAGADIVNLTGYDGGTGAARQHAIKHVGLPAEIGVVEAHRELIAAGLRSRVEIWCDGGMRTAADAVKMMCLGANRIGFGTLAMVAIGCTICRACQTDTCHVGIATQIETQEQARAHGLRRFVPQNYDRAVDGIVAVFGALGNEMRKITARLGFDRTQDLVGRADLLTQISHHDNLDLSDMLSLVQRRAKPSGVVRQLPLSSGIQLSQHPLRRPRNHLTTVISNMVMETIAVGETRIGFEDDKVSPVDRALGTHLAGALTRYKRTWNWLPGHGGVGGLPDAWRAPIAVAISANGHTVSFSADKPKESAVQMPRTNGLPIDALPTESADIETHLRFYASSVPGNGLGAYLTDPVTITVEGGAQDGVGKGMHGGRLVVLKGYNHDGKRLDGSVGKGLAYGAISGLVIVQGNADSRACIRLSGADVIIGGKLTQPLQDHLGYLGARANVKGFLCEYMTAGRVLVMGDPGPWIGAGMTGGVLYVRQQPRLGLTVEAIQRRIARGAHVQVHPVDTSDEDNLLYLLTEYAEELSRSHQEEAAQRVIGLLPNWQTHFIKIVPHNLQMDQTISTE